MRYHVKFNPNNSMILILSFFKMNQNRIDVKIQLTLISSQLCPVTVLNKLYSSFPRSANDPLFSQTRARSFTRLFVIQTIHHLLLQADIPTRDFSDHSLRKGATITAATNDMSRDEIKLLKRWKSNAVDVYINELSKLDITQKLLLLSFKLHISI